MNLAEKMGLVTTILGMGVLIALFILGGGDASLAVRDGVPISPVFPILLMVFGLVGFFFGDKF